MTVAVLPADPRSVRALAVLATADRWVKGHRKADGRPFFTIPGSNGRLYHADCRDCTCPASRRPSAWSGCTCSTRAWIGSVPAGRTGG